jgi:uroporphyrinogen decarboxylase
LLEKTDRYRVYIDSNGATKRDLNTPDGWTPQWLDFSIKNRDDWHHFKDHAKYNASRISKEIFNAYSSEREKGRFITYSVHGCFHATWNKIGMENLLVWMLEDPNLITDMFAVHTQLAIDIYEGIKSLGVKHDGAWVSDDLGYRNASLISPMMYHDLVMPYHKQLCDHFAKDSLKTILHSDGAVGALIPDFLVAGFTELHPLEVKAGMDVKVLKPMYSGRLVLFCNIDVRKLAGTKEEIEEEIRTKFTVAKEGGGYIYHSDHSVPSNVSFENYSFAVDMIKKYGEYK